MIYIFRVNFLGSSEFPMIVHIAVEIRISESTILKILLQK